MSPKQSTLVDDHWRIALRQILQIVTAVVISAAVAFALAKVYGWHIETYLRKTESQRLTALVGQIMHGPEKPLSSDLAWIRVSNGAGGELWQKGVEAESKALYQRTAYIDQQPVVIDVGFHRYLLTDNQNIFLASAFAVFLSLILGVELMRRNGRRKAWQTIDRLLAKVKLQRRETALLKCIVENSSSAIYLKDEQGCYQLVNQAYCDLFGVDRLEVIGNSDEHLLPPKLAARLRQNDMEVLRSGDILQRREITKQRDNQLHHFVSIKFPAADPHTNERYVCGISTDITEQVRAEEHNLDLQQNQLKAMQSLIVAQKKLLRSKKMQAKADRVADRALLETRTKSEFLATMSHEVRTPMNGVLGMAELLSKTPLTAQQHRYVDAINQSGQSLLRVINDLLDFSKLEAGKVTLEEIDFDLRALMDECLEMFALKSMEKKLCLVASMAEDVPAYIRGDPTRLKQVLINLLSNAFKFTEQGDVVMSVVCKQPANLENGHAVLHFSVSDSGIGIENVRQKGLFEDYVQAQKSTQRQYGGTGLGLGICRKLVGLFGGDIGVESDVGKGSTFWFTLEVQTLAHSLVKPEYLQQLKNKSILLWDSNQMFRDTTEQMLIGWGMTVHVLEKLKALDETLADLLRQGLALDVVLIEYDDDWTSAKALFASIHHHERYRTVPIIISTTLLNPDSSMSPKLLQEQHVFGFLEKPLGANFLQKQLFAALQQASIEEERPTEGALPNDNCYQPMRILVAEDNKINQMVVQGMLQRLGMDLTIVEDGEQAVATVCDKNNHWDLVLMDCEMPILNGFLATQKIRRWEAQHSAQATIIVALTAHAVAEYLQYALDVGMNAALTKPLVFSDLTGFIASCQQQEVSSDLLINRDNKIDDTNLRRSR